MHETVRSSAPTHRLSRANSWSERETHARTDSHDIHTEGDEAVEKDSDEMLMACLLASSQAEAEGYRSGALIRFIEKYYTADVNSNAITRENVCSESVTVM